MAENKIVVLNRSERTFRLKPIVLKDKDGNETGRTDRILRPGGSIETLDAAEAKHLLSFHRDIVDIEKAAPATANKIEVLHKANAELTAQIADLKKQLEEATAEKGDDSKGDKGRKAK